MTILEYDSSNNYECIWNEKLDTGATKIVKVISKGIDYAVICLNNGEIRFYDLSSRTLNFNLDGAVDGYPIRNITSADIDGDGNIELIVFGVGYSSAKLSTQKSARNRI